MLVQQLVVRQVEFLQHTRVLLEYLEQPLERLVRLSKVVLGQVQRDKTLTGTHSCDDMLQGFRRQSVVSEVEI